MHKARLLIIFGLPGSGKTTFGRALSAHLGIPHFNTDRIRAELGKRQQYNEQDKSFIYNQMLNRARGELQKGNGVILDGTFHLGAFREPFAALGRELGVPVKWIEIAAGEDVIRKRVSGPRPYSEADFEVYQKISREFEPLKGKSLRLHSDAEDLPGMIQKTVEYLDK